MKSNYGTSTCHKCGNKINVGDDISKDDGETKWHHTKCPGDIPDTPAPPPQQSLNDVRNQEQAEKQTKSQDAPDPLVAVQAFIDLMDHNKIVDPDKWNACSKVWNTERMQS